MKKTMVIALLGAALVVGCRPTRTSPAARGERVSTTPELTPPPAPAPIPTYTPAPEPAPTPTPTTATPAPAETVTPKPAVRPAHVEAKPAAKATGKTYLVKKGDTLSEIAKANHTTVQKIMALNPEIKKADMIFVGQKLKMP